MSSDNNPQLHITDRPAVVGEANLLPDWKGGFLGSDLNADWNGRIVAPETYETVDLESDQTLNRAPAVRGYRISRIANHIMKGMAGVLSAVTTAATIVAVATSSVVAMVVAIVAKTLFVMLGLHILYPQLKPHLPQSCRRVADVISAQVNDMFAMAAMALLQLCPVRQCEPRAMDDKSGRPILLVHGYLGFGSNWTYIRHRLREANLGPAFTLDLGHPLQSIDQHYAQKLADKIEEIKQLTGRSDIILIGHSMGGVVSSYYATHLAPEGTVTDVITLGSPLHGTVIAPIGVGQCAQQMQRGSDLLRNVRKKAKYESNVRFFHLWSRADQVILPNRSARMTAPEGHERRIQSHAYEDIGHATYLFSDKVADRIVNYIERVEAVDTQTN